MKKIIINLVLLLSIICTASLSYAEGAKLEATIEISTSITEASVGDKVTFTFVTRDIVNAVDNGKIYAISGKIIYDTNFFEITTTNGITLENTGVFNSTNAVTEGGTNGTITLKVKEGAVGRAIVTFTDLTASDGRVEDMETLGTAITEEQAFAITLKTAQEPTQSTDREEVKKENVIPNKNDTTDGNKKEDNTTTEGEKLPQTGIGLGLNIGLMAVVAMVVFAYLNYGKLRDVK